MFGDIKIVESFGFYGFYALFPLLLPYFLPDPSSSGLGSNNTVNEFILPALM